MNRAFILNNHHVSKVKPVHFKSKRIMLIWWKIKIETERIKKKSSQRKNSQG